MDVNTKQKVMSHLKRRATTDLNVKTNKLHTLYDKNYITAQLEHLSHVNVRLFRKSMYEAG
jgi:hypothetical protein